MNDAVKIYEPKLPVTITPAAITHIKSKVQKHQAIGMRIATKKAGCSGFKYVVDYVHTPNAQDQSFLIDPDLTIYIDPESLPIIYGTEIDYVREGINGVLKFKNPNEKGSCGCGESFSV